MRNDRRLREERLRGWRDDRDFYVETNIILTQRPYLPPRAVIWADEVDDVEMEDQLLAAPFEPLPELYPREVILSRPEVVMEQPAVRRALPSVELDTVHFGFNESFVSEEEIANLDRVGKIIEKIVAAHPDEVFMIEGHTDAVGSEEANLELSKARAEAVKQALTEYYVIAPENLSTVGLGRALPEDPDPRRRAGEPARHDPARDGPRAEIEAGKTAAGAGQPSRWPSIPAISALSSAMPSPVRLEVAMISG